MPATPPTARHGTWRLANAGDIDRRIRGLLDCGRNAEQIADQLGVASGYVEAFIRDERGADAPPHKIPREALPPAEAPTALSRVLCIVAAAEIGARDCIQRQCSSNCFCPKASFAINAVAPHAPPGSKLDEQLARCRTVARSVLTKPELEQRFLGPARAAFRGEKPVEELFAGELPAPPAAAPPDPRKPPQPPEPAVPRGELAAAPVVIAPKETPAPSAKEKPMAELTEINDSEFKKAHRDLGGNFSALALRFGTSVYHVKKRVTAMGLDQATPPAPAAAAPASDDPVVSLLEEQRKHHELRAQDHQAQISRIDKALAALRA